MTSAAAALVVSVVLAPSLVLPGVALLAGRRCRVAAAGMVGCGLVVLAAGVAGAEGRLVLEQRLTTVAALLLGPLVVLAYPRLRTTHPVDFLALVAVLTAGTLSAARLELASTMVLVVALVLLAHVWWSLETTRGEERRSTTWLAVTVAGATLVTATLVFALESAPGSVWAALAMVVVGPALLVGATRPELTDPRALVVEVTATLTTVLAVIAVFVGVAAPVVQALALDLSEVAMTTLALLAAGLAAAYGPVRRQLREAVGQLLLGHRPDPLAALDHLSRGVGAEPAEALHVVRQGLNLPWASVALDPPLTSGTRTGGVVLVPLGEGLPDLEVGLREEETHLLPGDRRVLALAAPLLGQAIRLHHLGVQVSESRAHTVRAVEDERRRLRRDLHDGLGPALSGLAFTGDAAGNLLGTDPAAAGPLIDVMRRQARDALADVRRLVYGMRPPALDELGLVGALAQAAGELHPGATERVELLVGDLPPLTAAVEVAAYRIAVEALTNVARHAPGTRAQVRLEVRADHLVVEVRDDAVTRDGGTAWTPGLGLASMRERAEELRGTLHAAPGPTGGHVLATLPLDADAVRRTASALSTP